MVQRNLFKTKSVSSTYTPLGAATVTPGVGDLIVKAEQTAGPYNASVSIMYHSER